MIAEPVRPSWSWLALPLVAHAVVQPTERVHAQPKTVSVELRRAPHECKRSAPAEEWTPMGLHRIAGETQIVPNDLAHRASAWFAYCVADGHVTRVERKKSTGDPDYDRRLATGVFAWQFAPHAPACDRVLFIYTPCE